MSIYCWENGESEKFYNVLKVSGLLCGSAGTWRQGCMPLSVWSTSQTLQLTASSNDQRHLLWENESSIVQSSDTELKRDELHTGKNKNTRTLKNLAIEKEEEGIWKLLLWLWNIHFLPLIWLHLAPSLAYRTWYTSFSMFWYSMWIKSWGFGNIKWFRSRFYSLSLRNISCFKGFFLCELFNNSTQ